MFEIELCYCVLEQKIFTQGRILGGLWGPGPPGVTKGAPKRKKEEKEKKERGEKRGKEGNKKEKREERGSKKEKKERKKVKSIWREGRHAVSSASRGSREENVRGAKLTEKRTRGAPCSFKCKPGLQGRKRQGRQIDGEKDERGAMQFQVQAGAPGKKTSGAPNWRRKGREGRHAVSSASRGSREENVRGAKLTEKRTRVAPCSFKCKQGLQGRKRQGRQIDGEKDESGAMQFQVQAGAPGKKKSGAPNWRRKGREMHHAVSSANRGSREENVRGAKLTEKRTRGAPCSFKCKQGLQGRKSQGRQIDGEKDERCAMQFQVQTGGPGKKTSGAPNWRRKGQEGRHAVSSASRGSREENVRGAKLTEKRTRGAPCSFKCKQGLQGRKRQDAKLMEKKTRGAPCSFKCKQGLQGRKRQGRQINGKRKRGAPYSFKCKQGLQGRKRQDAKLTEKKTRGAPCSFKCKQGLQGRKLQGRQIDGEKENKSLNCQTYFPFDFKIRNVVFLNSIIIMLVSFTFRMYSTTPRQCRPWSYRGKKLVIPSWQMAKEVNTVPHHPHSLKNPGRSLATNWL